VGPPLANLAPSPPVENLDDATSHTHRSPMLTNGKPTPTKSSGTAEHSDQTDFQIHETLEDLSSVFGSSHEPSFEELRIPPDTGTYNGNYLPIVHAIRIVHVDDHRTASAPGTHLERRSLEADEWRINEIAEVTQPVNFPSNSYHIFAIGARAEEHKVRCEWDN